ncbi:hypothetical protein C3V43_10745 [Bacteroides heparinolyticus]|nr:hypothetical protein C3V43_10745 [Bacteroides heparinolyticus]
MVINFHIVAKYFSSTSFVKRSILCVLSLSCLIGIFLGFILCDLIPSVQDVGDENHSVIGQLSTMKPIERFFFIAKNNVLVGCKCFCGGLFSLGFFSVISNMYSAFVFGVVLKKSTVVLSVEKILYTTLPHSLEIVGIIGMGYVGTILGISLLCRKLYLSLIRMVLLFIVSLLLILISACIESYISIC